MGPWLVLAALWGAQAAEVCLLEDRARLLLGLEKAPEKRADQEGTARPGDRACQTLVASVLLALVLASVVHVCKLCYQDNVASPDGVQASAETSSPRRRCSLVELTVNRHARRESLLRHASSLDNSYRPHRMIVARPVPLLRRSSFPVHPSAIQDSQPHTPGCTTPGKLSRRASVEVSEGDSSPDTTRRRVRIIRRH